MNNQAAQTMPELPEPAMPASSGGVEGNWEGDTYPDLYDAAQMHQYARDYAAALSQTAGVADGFVLVPREPSEAMLDAMHECIRIRCDPAKRTADIQNDREVWTAMLAAAPAASGVDTSTNEAWAARAQEKIEAMDAAASVSERARELFSAMLSAPYGDTTMGDIVCAETTRNRLESAWLPILEQALTQQRGEISEVTRQLIERDHRGRQKYGATLDRTDLSLPDWLQHMAEELMDAAGYALAAKRTTPQPSSDAVRELVKRWRECAKSAANGPMFDGASEYAVAGTYIACADELESLLSAASGEGVDDTKRLDWIARQGGYEFDFGILNDQPGDGDWFVHGMGGSGQGATFRDAIDAAIKEEAGGQDANTDILDTLAFKTENGDAGRGSVTYIASVASGEADHQQNAAQGGGEK